MTYKEKLITWVSNLEEISKEFPGNNISIITALKSFKSQIKELDKNGN